MMVVTADMTKGAEINKSAGKLAGSIGVAERLVRKAFEMKADLSYIERCEGWCDWRRRPPGRIFATE